MTNNNCIPKLIRNIPHNCSITNAEHIKQVEEVESGLILLNDFTGNIFVNESEQKLNGSYLIRFHNVSVKINNSEFESKEVAYSKPLPALLQHVSTRSDIEEILSLEFLKSLHVRNNQRIERLNFKFESSILTNAGLVTIMICVALVMAIRRNKNTDKIVVRNEFNTETAGINEGPNKNLMSLPTPVTAQDIPCRKSLYNIPFY